MNQETLSFRPISFLDYLSPEQHQAILYGPYFNGLDKPLLSIEQAYPAYRYEIPERS